MKKIKRICIIGDQSVNQNYLHHLLGGTDSLQDLSTLNFEAYQYIPSEITIQAYYLPKNRDLKTYSDLYMDILPKPDLIIYAVDLDSPKIEIKEWLNILVSINDNMRICFFSQARSYLQRQHIFSKISPLFYRDITDHILFPNIDSSCVGTCFCNIGEVGIFLMHYAKKIPTFSRMKNFFRKITDKKNTEEQII